MLSANENQPVTEETNVPEGRGGLFGGQSVYTTESGVRTIIKWPMCDRCNRRLGEEYIFCRPCGRKICKKCSIFYEIENVFYCEDCVQQRLPLNKKEYLILSGFARLSKRKEVSKLALIKGSDTKEIIHRLVNAGFLFKKGFSVFSSVEMTQEGAVVLAIYRQVYGEHPDILEFVKRLTSKVQEKEDEKAGSS